jgi:hypothetical protein
MGLTEREKLKIEFLAGFIYFVRLRSHAIPKGIAWAAIPLFTL